MKLYEIDNAILSLVDENGEITDIETLELLQMEREKKLENIGCWIKNLTAEAEAIKTEETALSERRKRAEKKVESLKNYLSYALNGQKFETAKVSVSFRKSERVDGEIENVPKKWLITSYKLDRTAIKQALKEGKKIKGVTLAVSHNIQIK